MPQHGRVQTVLARNLASQKREHSRAATTSHRDARGTLWLPARERAGSRLPCSPMLLSICLGAVLGCIVSLPPAPGLGLGLSYGLMALAQSRGEQIIALLHNATAAAAAAAPTANNDVDAHQAFHEICVGYEAHHHNSESNALHAAGMLLAAGIIALAATATTKTRGVRLVVWAWVPPTWYLFAWVGHYFHQADIPAVFTYGTTLYGWASGEACAVKALLAGRSVRVALPPSVIGTLSVG